MEKLKERKFRTPKEIYMHLTRNAGEDRLLYFIWNLFLFIVFLVGFYYCSQEANENFELLRRYGGN
jgi:hypothetical protein